MICFIQFTYCQFKNKYLISTSKFPQSIFKAQVLQLYLWLAIPINLLSHIIGHPISSSQNCTSRLSGHNHLLLSLLTLILFLKCSLNNLFFMHILIYLLNCFLTFSININCIVWYCYPFFIVINCHPVWWFYTRAIYCALFFFPKIVIIFDKKIVIIIICCSVKEWVRNSINLRHVILINPLIHILFIMFEIYKLTTSINNTPFNLFSNWGVYKACAWCLILLLQHWTLKLFAVFYFFIVHICDDF